MSSTVNVLEHPTEEGRSRPAGFRSPGATLGDVLGATALGASVYDLPPGESVCPYHYELGREEWLLVLDGRPSVRTPEGEQGLEPWDVVCFSDGPEGAHQVTNRTAAPVRVLIVSTKEVPVVRVYPDSQKLGVSGINGFFRFDDAVGYWHGEGEEQASD